MRTGTPDAPSPDASRMCASAGYGACTNRRGSLDAGTSTSRPNSYEGASHGEDTPVRQCDTLSFRHFSRSVKVALALGRALETDRADREKRLHDAETATGDVSSPPHEPHVEPPTAPPSGPRRWHDMAHDTAGLLELLRESAILLCALFLSSAIAITSINLHWGPTPTFFLCFVALIPLAVLLGDLTESLSGWCGPTAGGLLNATLGNATEAIVLVQAVRHGLVGVEQAALLGGVLSNMLLVVGLSFIFGGIATGGSQTFDRRVTVADIGVLLVSVIAVILPSIAASAPGGSERDTLADSRSTALVLLFMYAAFLVYTLSPTQEVKVTCCGSEEPASVPLLLVNEDGSTSKQAAHAAEEEDESEQPSLSFWSILMLLVLVTFIMAILSNALVLNVFPVSAALNITPDLVSCIFLPIIGNIAELFTAVIAARRGAVDLSLAVALGSSTQISLFLLPCAAMLGWAIGVPFSFDFAPTFATAFFASVVVVAVVVMDGEANWLKGCMLIGTYVIFAVGLLTNAGAAGVGGPAAAPAAAPTA